LDFQLHYEACERVGCRKCDEYDERDEYEERFIPCCVCGSNCEGGDYERYGICSRYCLVRDD
jgi:hypothetical protein